MKNGRHVFFCLCVCLGGGGGGCDLKAVFLIYADGRKKRYNNILSCIACGSQIRAAQAHHDQNLKSRLGVILICRFCLPGMLANIHAYTLTAVTIVFVLSKSSHILEVVSEIV